MTDEVRIALGNELDTSAHAAMQQAVFGHVLEENAIPLDRLGPDVFAWKLNPPAGPARVALIERQGAIVSSCTAYPVVLASGERRVRGWHVCDAATVEEARGQRLFGRVLDALHDALPRDDWTFAFPNEQSRGAFERIDYHAALDIPLWFRPTIGKGRRTDRVVEVTAFGAEHDAFADRLAEQSAFAPLRSAAYLTWRYSNHPFFRYECFELRREGRIDGLLVVNRMEARGRVSLWVMELLATDPSGLRELALAARWLGKEQQCDVVLSMASQKLPGAIRLPPCFLPKKHLLMVRSEGTTTASKAEWTAQTGDWDTF